MDEPFDEGNDQCSHVINVSPNQQNEQNSEGNLYLSSVFVLPCKIYLKQKKINCILSIVDAHTYNYYKIKDCIQSAGIKHHKWINLQDYQKADIYPHLDQSHFFIKEMLKTSNVIVHCHVGVSRSATIVLAYLIKQFGWDYDHAYQYLQQKRPIVDPNEGFVASLKKFQKVTRLNNPQRFMKKPN